MDAHRRKTKKRKRKEECMVNSFNFIYHEKTYRSKVVLGLPLLKEYL